MRAKLNQLDGLRTQLRGRLAEYLGVTPGRNFRCISPAHRDNTPSMGIIPSNPELAHCLGCGVTVDIFTAAHFKEGKPLKGPGFLVDNMFHLARKYGIDVPTLELSEKEQRDMDTYRAYATAAHIVLTCPLQQIVADKLKWYGWSEQTQQNMGVGAIYKYDDYLNLMVNAYGFDRDFLHSIDLDNPKIFAPHKLLFIVKDEHGQPVGFAARDLQYDEQKATYQAAVAEFGEGSIEAEAAKPTLVKFINSAASVRGPNGQEIVKNHIYEKSKRLYGLHVAKRNTPPLWIFEGYADAVTAHNAGMHNACAIGATAFTKDHLEMLLNIEVNHFVFVLDGDKAGARGTERMVKLVEELFSNRIGLKVEIVVIPQGGDDPDTFIRTQGLEAFLELERIDIFAWKLHNAIENGQDPDKLFEETVGLILNEVNQLKQFRMAQTLAKATGIPEEVVRAEVERRKDIEGQKLKGEMLVIAQSTVQALSKHPDRLPEILTQTQERVERVSVSKNRADTQSLLDYYDMLRGTARNNKELGGLQTGYPIFDARFGGIPKQDAFLTFPGKANHGKAQPLDAMLKTPTGWIRMGDAQIGQRLASVDGRESVITGIFPQGFEKVYRVTFSDGRSTECSGDHLWSVQFCSQYAKGFGDQNRNGWMVYTTDAIRSSCLNGSRKNKHRAVQIPVVNGIFGSRAVLPVKPWLLGVLLGDGGLLGATPTVHNVDEDVLENVRLVLLADDMELRRQGESCSYQLVKKRDERNEKGHMLKSPLAKSLEALGLSGVEGSAKFIPEQYLLADKSAREAVLQGLMDTDGTAGKTGEASYTSCSEQLAKDVQTLVRSLGGLATIHPKQPKCRYKGKWVAGQKAYTVNIRMPEQSNLFSVKRKAVGVPKRKNFPRLAVTNVEYVGEKETQCIRVSHPSKLYITDDYIVTHNTSFGANVVGRLADRYSDLVFLVHTIDDSLSKFYTRILSARFGIPSWYFEFAGYHLEQGSRVKWEVDGSHFESPFAEALDYCEEWLRKHMIDERILPFDVSQMPNTVDTLEWKVKEMRKRYQSSPLIVFADNFHKYEMPGDGTEQDIRSVSNRMKNMTTIHRMTLMATMEIPKAALAPGARPRGDNMKGSGGLLYDSSANIGVYNEKKDLREEKAVLMWDKLLDAPEEVSPGNFVHSVKQPVLELIFDKSKLFKGFDGDIYYVMDERTGQLTECDGLDQDRWRKVAAEAEEERRDKKKNKRGAFHPGGYVNQPSYARADDEPFFQ